MDNSFPTFFHINQRGEDGYRDLPRLVAMSQPLTLWAPSSVILRSSSSGIAPNLFLDLLEEGHIRVMGRHKWLSEPRFRNSSRWPGTDWVPGIDDRIQGLAEEDEGKPVGEQRVVVAPEEKGYEWADEYLSEHPGQASEWFARATRKGAAKTIPGGTLEAIHELGDDRVAVARRILRDAYNHGRALLESRARVPILQSFTHRKFLEVLAQAPAIEEGEEGRRPPADEKPQASQVDDLAAMTRELVQILATLDLKGPPDSKRLHRFLRSSGHRELIAWMSGICTEYERHRPQIVDGLLLERLQQELDRAPFYALAQEVRQHPDELGVGAVGLVAAIVGAATGGIGVAAVLGIGASVYPAGKGLARELGFIPSTFNGPQWPFLYTTGHGARKRQPRKVQDALATLKRLDGS